MQVGIFAIQTSQPQITGGPVHLQAGQHAAANLSIANTGQLPGSYQLTAILRQSNGLTGGHMVQSGGSNTTVTGTVAPGQTVVVSLVSEGVIADQSQVGPYLDLVISLTDTSTGESAEIQVPQAYIPPPEPSVLTITSIALGSA